MRKMNQKFSIEQQFDFSGLWQDVSSSCEQKTCTGKEVNS